MPDEPQFIDDDHAAIVGFAEAYLEDDERDDFIDQMMERRGYQRVSSWAAPEPDPRQPAGGEGRRKPLVKAPQPASQQRRGPYFKR
jgi:hypothetical protein